VPGRHSRGMGHRRVRGATGPRRVIPTTPSRHRAHRPTLTEALSDRRHLPPRRRSLRRFQNGVGPQVRRARNGNLDSTTWKLTLHGTSRRAVDVAGKADGVTADPATGSVIATVNEDANSRSTRSTQRHPQRSSTTATASHCPRRGDRPISVYFGRIFISASAPGTTGTNRPLSHLPAAYSVTLDAGTSVAAVTPSSLTRTPPPWPTSAGWGQQVTLALTDRTRTPSCRSSAALRGDFELTSQGDLQQIDVRDPGDPVSS